MDESLPSDEESAKGTGNWPHAPPHRLASAGVYFLTARTRDQRHHLEEDSIKDWFQEKLLAIAIEFGWHLEAWAVLSNHYHFIAHSPQQTDGAESLGTMVKKLHSLATQELNRREGKLGRTRLWQNFRETHLTFQRSYLARLNYVHQNAAHHGLVSQGSDYKWCSARLFRQAVAPAWIRTISSFNYDEIAREDGE